MRKTLYARHSQKRTCWVQGVVHFNVATSFIRSFIHLSISSLPTMCQVLSQLQRAERLDKPGLILVLLEYKILLHGHSAFDLPCPLMLEGFSHSRTCSGFLWPLAHIQTPRLKCEVLCPFSSSLLGPYFLAKAFSTVGSLLTSPLGNPREQVPELGGQLHYRSTYVVLGCWAVFGSTGFGVRPFGFNTHPHHS